MSRIPTVALGRTFTHVPEHVRQDLETLDRECAVYADHWIDEIGDFRHVRIAFTSEEAEEFGRRSWAYELFLRSGQPEYSRDVPGIDRDVAAQADSYGANILSGPTVRPYHCFAAFLGPHLEALVCTNTERCVVIEVYGRQAVLFNVRRTIETLTPTIRSFNNREKGLARWSITCEDDVRDLLYVMLRPLLFDLVKEEPVPSLAGTHKYVDLCSRAVQVLIEVKWIANRGNWRRIVDQMHVDTQTYATHPACRDLVFVVVDCARDIPDPRLLAVELTAKHRIGAAEIDVRTIVCEP